MKKLKRIESALNQTFPSGLSSTPSSSHPGALVGMPPSSDPRPISFDVQSKSGPKSGSKLEQPFEQRGAIVSSQTSSLPPNDSSVSWQLTSSRNVSEISLSLPRVATSGFTTHRNAANPSLAVNLLKEIETLVSGWQVELQQILKQIQDIYLEGAIVDGWLESYSQEALDSPALRHVEVSCLMDYVEKTWGDAAESSEQDLPLTPVNASGYRLCGLNEDGQLWFRHCPPVQLPAVSLAIARYQKLKLLLARKQSLETRLSQLAETLISMHAELKQN